MANELINLDAISIHLTLKDYKGKDGKTLQSCLTAGLNEARYITGRNSETGKVDPKSNTHGNPGRWTGAICYLTVLDQIGNCYRPDGKIKLESNMSGIKKALFYFVPTMTKDEVIAVYALRNAFMHNFSILNMYERNTGLCHNFSVDNHETNPVVIMPKERWDGVITNANSENVTYVNLRALGDLVESIYLILNALHSEGNLRLDLQGGENELFKRYTFMH